MKIMVRILFSLSLGLLLSGCGSLPYYVPMTALSRLGETTIIFDPAKHQGINLIITNDLKSDVFLKLATAADFVTQPVDTEQPFRLPDMDETRRHQADMFMFIWAGNTGFYQIFNPVLTQGVNYYVAISYYNCEEQGFYTKSVKIIRVNHLTGATHGQR